jgi:hypothetical protein
MDRRRNVNMAQGLTVATVAAVFSAVGWFAYRNVADVLRCAFWGAGMGTFATGLFLMFIGILDRRRPG